MSLLLPYIFCELLCGHQVLKCAFTPCSHEGGVLGISVHIGVKISIISVININLLTSNLILLVWSIRIILCGM